MELSSAEDIKGFDRVRAINAMNLAAYHGRNDLIDAVLSLDFPEGRISPDEYPAIALPAMIAAASRDHVDTIRYLADKGANVNLVARHCTALRTAANARSYAAINALLDLGADPNIENSNGCVALHLLCDQFADADIPSIERLLPITHRRYYQRAHDWCRNSSMREKIASRGYVDAVQPADGFGGPNDKEDDRWSLPAEHPLVEQFRLALLMCENTLTDPNKLYNIHMHYYALPGSKWQPASASELEMDDALLLNIASVFRKVAKITDERLPMRIPVELAPLNLLYPEIVRRYNAWLNDDD